MNSNFRWLGSALMLVCATCSGEDVLTTSPNASRLLFENEHVRIIELSFAPGARVGPYSHPAGWYYVTQAGKVRAPGSTRKEDSWEPEVGEQSWSKGEASHINESYGETTLKYIYVEVKAATTGIH